MSADRITCQVAGGACAAQERRASSARTRGHHEPYSRCQGSGYRAVRWPVGQRLRHHGGSVWEVIEDRGGFWGDYLMRCVIGSRATFRDGWLEEPGKTMVTHGEYMHRHGWTEVSPDKAAQP